jgi:hypothetical protein
MTIRKLVHPTEAVEWAVLTYEDRAQRMFEREDRARGRGDDASAKIYHATGLTLCFVARSEVTNRVPAGLGR